MSRSLSVFVCGKFHYKNYLKYLVEFGSLDRLYFSHKIREEMGVPAGNRVNFFAKEYLLGAHLVLLGERLLNLFMHAYHFAWVISCVLFSRHSEVNLFLIHGNCLRILKKIKKTGCLVVGEVVNVHPTKLGLLLEKEAQDLGVKSKFSGRLSRKIIEELSYCDYLIAPSQTVKLSYVECGYPENKIYVLPYGVDRNLPVSVGAREPDRKVRILFVGQVMIRKGVHHLLHSVKLAEGLGVDVSVTLVGREDPEYLNRIKFLGVSFEHIGHVKRDLMIDFMSSFDVLVLPSIEDGFGMVVLEAMEAGIPVLVSKFAGASEVVASVGGGEVFDPFDHYELAMLLKKISDGHKWSVESKDLSWRAYAEKLNALVVAGFI